MAELEGSVTLQFEDVKGATWAGGVTRTVPIIEEKRSEFFHGFEFDRQLN